jgi:ATP-dependent DNA helicase RecG
MEKIIDNQKLAVSQLHSIGSKLSNDFKKLGIENIDDLLWFFPWRYQDLSQIKTIAELNENETTTLKVKIEKINSYRSWRKKILITEAKISDETGTAQALWFNQKFISQILKVGDEIFLSGNFTLNKKTWTSLSPTYEKIKEHTIHTARLVPLYHLSGKISQKQIRFLIDRALKISSSIDDPLPVDILNKEKYPWLFTALQEIHFPTDSDKLDQAVARLKFQELFYLQCKYQLAKLDYQSKTSQKVAIPTKILNEQIKELPFKLTTDQKNALADILADLSKTKAMNRLLEGDVGSGKTIVAILAALAVINNGQQVAFMAPTEILAYQHFINCKKILGKKYLNQIALLTNNYNQVADNNILKNDLTKKINKNEIKLVIGTHALIQDKINFANLNLVIIDEQHRFGVRQRQTLKEKNPDKPPHLLSMTATPIPRTLSLTLYGDLDISLIKTKPTGRQEIKTFIIPESKRADAYKFIREKVALKQQVFFICPLIDESDLLAVKSVTQEYQKLNEEIFPELEIRYLHGKMKNNEKEKIMNDFKANKFPILVATSVIEVGVDIPQATVMIIESAERFGLSQLHQFRGRIGRNSLESFCLLFTTDKTHDNIKRLKALTKTNDGFKLAELDLELRGAGEMFGTRQTGLMELKIAKLSDTELIKKAHTWAKEIINNKKYLSNIELQNLLKKLKTEMHLE